MRTAVVSIVVAFLSAAGGVLIALIGARYTMVVGLRKQITRLDKQIFDLRTEMQSLYFINDILAQHCPDVDERVLAVRERIAKRREKYENERN